MTVDSDVNIVRDALDDYHGYVASDPTEPDAAAYAALDAMALRLDTAEREHRYALGLIQRALVEKFNWFCDCPVCKRWIDEALAVVSGEPAKPAAGVAANPQEPA